VHVTLHVHVHVHVPMCDLLEAPLYRALYRAGRAGPLYTERGPSIPSGAPLYRAGPLYTERGPSIPSGAPLYRAGPVYAQHMHILVHMHMYVHVSPCTMSSPM
jgi:hypothetical protein